MLCTNYCLVLGVNREEHMAETPVQPQRAEPMEPWSWFLITFAILWCWLVAWVSGPGRYSLLDPYVIGRAVGMPLLPFLIAYVLRGRKKKRNWNSFARWFFWLALILAALQYNVRSGQMAADRRAERDLGRQVIQEVQALQTRHKSDPRCEFDPPLYSAASFANKQSIERSIEQLNACLSLYDEMQAELETLVTRMEATANSSFSSSEYREDVLRRFREGFQQGTAQRQMAATSRKRWKEETTALYDFALRSADQIQARNDEIIITDSSVLAQFNRMLKPASEAQDELIRVETGIQAAGQAKMEELNQMLK